MKIGIDVSMLVYQGSGVATYTYNLVKNLLTYEKDHEYRLFYSSLRRPKNFSVLDEFRALGGKVYDFRFPPRTIKYCWNSHHVFPIEWFIGKVHIFHSSDFLRPPLLEETKGVTTIHDLTWKIYPQFHTKDIIAAHEKKLEKTILYRDTIIVDSHNTKKDLLRYYPTIEKSNTIHVLYPGVDERFKPIEDQQKIKKVLEKYHLKYPQKYLLYVGAIEPRKNLLETVKIYEELIRDKKYADYVFLIVGKAGWKNESFFMYIKKRKLHHKVIFVGYVQNDDLPCFYSAASVLIYLSLYEGFGLPPLEAARCGSPSLLYKNSSLQEIFPSSYQFAVLGNELSVLKQILKNPKTISKQWFDQFNWKLYAQQFIQLCGNELKS